MEEVILGSLLTNEEYVRQVIPHINPDYFPEKSQEALFRIIKSFVTKYNEIPTKEAIEVEIDNLKIPQNLYKEIYDVLNSLKSSDKNTEWLVERTEKWCQERAITNAIYKAVDILEKGEENKGSLPQIMTDALAVSFDKHVGHDLIEDWVERFEEYQKKEKKIAFNIHWLNKVTNGGVQPKTLNIILAGTGVGKTLSMCHFAASNLLDGLNVLYISMELSEIRIAERIEANIMDIDVNHLRKLTKDEYERKIKTLENRVRGKLIIKEYPTATANVNHFRHLLHELKLKKNFVPDVVFVDYLSICSSARVGSSRSGMYEVVKSIAEELRGLAVEYNIPVWSASQVNRGGLDSTELSLSDIAESMGLAHTADFVIGMTTNEELALQNQVMFQQLKNRYGDVNKNRKSVIGIDYSRMKFYDVNVDEDDDGPIIMDQNFGLDEYKSKFDGIFK